MAKSGHTLHPSICTSDTHELWVVCLLRLAQRGDRAFGKGLPVLRTRLHQNHALTAKQ